MDDVSEGFSVKSIDFPNCCKVGIQSGASKQHFTVMDLLLMALPLMALPLMDLPLLLQCAH
ncbi:MAG: hypothetical protein AB8B99_09785 [Phormidesmis sp.]